MSHFLLPTFREMEKVIDKGTMSLERQDLMGIFDKASNAGRRVKKRLRSVSGRQFAPTFYFKTLGGKMST
jgi:hypothetical protein